MGPDAQADCRERAVAINNTAEYQRLVASAQRRADWKDWGPYVSDRAWGTVREDYSSNGDAWSAFPHDHARSRVYRWNEDGLGAFCNRFQNLCLGLAVWNGVDPFLKERLFGLTNAEGNHGEDVKELYYHLDALPTHAYMAMRYRYPIDPFPYDLLRAENTRRGRHEPEFEILDALGDAFAQGRFFDIDIEWAKEAPQTILGRITAVNHSAQPATLHILPHAWFRNSWSWGHHATPHRPSWTALDDHSAESWHKHLGARWWWVEPGDGFQGLMFTENETNRERIHGESNAAQPYVKDAFHEAIVAGRREAINPERRGSKLAAHFVKTLQPGESWTIRHRCAPTRDPKPFETFETTFTQRRAEANEFYETLAGPTMSADRKAIQRSAYAGLMWTKQFYHYSVELWLNGDPSKPVPPQERRSGRNANWRHLTNLDVISMPDKWEYPWYAAWDLAFHCVPIARIDPEWAKRQLILMLREWYMHPNGQIPAYEWNFSDVNPPVHAWACLRVYEIDRAHVGRADTQFLEEVFHKLLLNFTWWVNRKDASEKNIFQGGFLGLDNIGVFDRSKPLPDGATLEQADGTAWMAMYCLNMLAIALELARTRPAYESIATKFFEHFIAIAHAVNAAGGLWSDDDGFYYDAIRLADGSRRCMKLRSFVGLIPLFAVEILDEETLRRLPKFHRRMQWFLKYRPRTVPLRPRPPFHVA